MIQYESKNNNAGVNIASILFLIFLVLKLTNLIDWSWWWVFSPIWISFGAIVFFGFGYFIVSSIIKKINKRK